MKKKNFLTLVLFLSVIFGFGIGFWLIPDKAFSEGENRTLQSLPSLTAKGILEGKFAKDVSTYYTDQFPFRDTMLTWGAVTQLAMGRGEANGVLVGRGGQLAVRKFDAYIDLTQRASDTDYFHKQHIQNTSHALGALAQKTSVPLTVFPAPRTIDVTLSAFDYPTDLSDSLHDTVFSSLKTAGVDTLDMTDTYRTLYNKGEYVYYRTDHHWTTWGAYMAYVALMEHWGMADIILPPESFTIRQIPDFFGTTWSRAGLCMIPPDTLEIWVRGDDSTYVMKDKNGEILQHGFVDETYLSGKDKYGSFLSGTRQFLTIEQPNTPKPRLLVARDSFASALAPFLSRHFDLVLLNLTGGMTRLSHYAQAYDCQRILVLCNLENFVTSNCLLCVE